MEFPNRLTGFCDLHWPSNTIEKVQCNLDFISGRFVCHLSFDCLEKDIHHEKLPEIKNVEIITPRTRLKASQLYPSFKASAGGERWDSDATRCSEVTGVLGKSSTISFIFNSKIEFDTDFEHHEILCMPPVTTVFPVELSKHLTLYGSKHSVSIVGDTNFNKEEALFGLSLVLGVPVSKFCEWEENKIYFWLNNYNKAYSSHPIIARSKNGEKLIDKDTVNKNFRALFEKAIGFYSSLSGDAKPKALNPINSLLAARSSTGGYNLSLLGIFHFLEWLDGSKRMSGNSLFDKLDISLDEAKAIVVFRNDILHANALPEVAIQTCFDKLVKSNTAEPTVNDKRDIGDDYKLLNYLHTKSANGLAKKVGYTGDTEFYLPVE